MHALPICRWRTAHATVRDTTTIDSSEEESHASFQHAEVARRTRRLHRLYLSVCPHRPAHRPLGLVSADDDRADPELRHALDVRVRALAGRRRSAEQLTVDVSRSGRSLHTIACDPTFPQILLATMWVACAYRDQALDPKGFRCIATKEARDAMRRRVYLSTDCVGKHVDSLRILRSSI